MLGVDFLEAQGFLVGSCVQKCGDCRDVWDLGSTGGGSRGAVERGRLSGRGWRWWLGRGGTRLSAIDEAETRGRCGQRELER